MGKKTFISGPVPTLGRSVGRPGPDHIYNNVTPHLGPLTTNMAQSARNFGVVFDLYLNFNQHIKSLVQSCYLQIRNIAKVEPMLPKKHSWTTYLQPHFLLPRPLQFIIYLTKRCISCPSTVSAECSSNASHKHSTQGTHYFSPGWITVAPHPLQNSI